MVPIMYMYMYVQLYTGKRVPMKGKSTSAFANLVVGDGVHVALVRTEHHVFLERSSFAEVLLALDLEERVVKVDAEDALKQRKAP